MAQKLLCEAAEKETTTKNYFTNLFPWFSCFHIDLPANHQDNNNIMLKKFSHFGSSKSFESCCLPSPPTPSPPQPQPSMGLCWLADGVLASHSLLYRQTDASNGWKMKSIFACNTSCTEYARHAVRRVKESNDGDSAFVPISMWLNEKGKK